MRLFRSPTLSLTMLAMVASIGWVLSVPSHADACAIETENARKVESHASQLPDCRAYEQVSPVDKNTTDATGRPGFVQSAPSGEGISYDSAVPFPELSGAAEFPSYVSKRAGTRWLTQGLNPLTEPGAESDAFGLTVNDEEALVFVTAEAEEKFLLAPGAEIEHGNAYVRNNITGKYKLLAARPGAVHYAGSTPDGSRILFTDHKTNSFSAW